MGYEMGQGAPAAFKPFSTTYQEQMSQCVLNLNIFLNPYPMAPILPPMDVALHAKQQLSMLHYSLVHSYSQMHHHLQMQMQMQMRPPPLPHPSLHPPLEPSLGAVSRVAATFIVIDE
jgi:hypothetical protein